MTGNVLALVGLVLLALAMTGAVLMVTEFLFGLLVGALTAAAVAAVLGAVWFGIAAAFQHANEGVVTDGDRIPPGQ